MSAPITYAKVNGPPINWINLEIFDGDTKLDGVIEVDTVAGYAIQYYRDDKGRWVDDGDKLVTRRIESANLTIRVRE